MYQLFCETRLVWLSLWHYKDICRPDNANKPTIIFSLTFIAYISMLGVCPVHFMTHMHHYGIGMVLCKLLPKAVSIDYFRSMPDSSIFFVLNCQRQSVTMLIFFL